MEKRELGQTGILIPVIGQGTWMMESHPQQSIQSLQRGIELGLTHIDTAEMYGSGKVETLVGQAIQGCREKVFLVSKVLPSHATFKGTLAACEQSLKKLKTDYLDLYLLHWPGNTPFEETYRAFDRLKQDGKIRFCGVSNFDQEELKQAIAVAGNSQIVCNQILYHLKERSIENKILPWCHAQGISVVGYSPFGQDEFPSACSPAGRTLQSIADKNKVSPRQLALRFLTRHPGTFAIPKASRVEHVEENAGALGFLLSEEDIQILEKIFPCQNRKSLPTL